MQSPTGSAPPQTPPTQSSPAPPAQTPPPPPPPTPFAAAERRHDESVAAEQRLQLLINQAEEAAHTYSKVRAKLLSPGGRTPLGWKARPIRVAGYPMAE